MSAALRKRRIKLKFKPDVHQDAIQFLTNYGDSELAKDAFLYLVSAGAKAHAHGVNVEQFLRVPQRRGRTPKRTKKVVREMDVEYQLNTTMHSDILTIWDSSRKRSRTHHLVMYWRLAIAAGVAFQPPAGLASSSQREQAEPTNKNSDVIVLRTEGETTKIDLLTAINESIDGFGDDEIFPGEA